jgi:hypothetical protein
MAALLSRGQAAVALALLLLLLLPATLMLLPRPQPLQAAGQAQAPAQTQAQARLDSMQRRWRLQRAAEEPSISVDLEALLQLLDQSLSHCGRIPRRMHFLALRADKATAAVRQAQQDSWRSFRRRNPGWQLLMWDEVRLQQFLAARDEDSWRVLQRLHNIGLIVDLSRYAVIQQLGGFYSDLDIYHVAGTLDQLLGCGAGTDGRWGNFTFAYVFEGKRDGEGGGDEVATAIITRRFCSHRGLHLQRLLCHCRQQRLSRHDFSRG